MKCKIDINLYYELLIEQNNSWNLSLKIFHIVRTLENFKMDLAPVVNKNRTHLSSFE